LGDGDHASDPFHAHAHEIAVHRPQDFGDAVTDLRARTQSLADLGTQARRAENWRGAVSKLADIVRWLPEIAADGDMPEDQWNQVNQQSKSMTRLVAPLLASIDRGEAIDMRHAMSQWSAHLSVLESVAARGDWRDKSGQQSDAELTSNLPKE